MSHLTDRARQAAPAARIVPGRMLDDVLSQAQAERRSLLRCGLGVSIATLAGPFLTGCGGSGSGDQAPDYALRFAAIPRTRADTVTVAAGYSVDLVFSAGDAVVAGASAYTGSFLNADAAEKVAGGNHDGMHFYALPGVDPNQGGLLAVNHEYPDFDILTDLDYDPETASAALKKTVLSAVGVSVIEVARGADGAWAVKRDSTHNKRYSGNTDYVVSGPAAGVLGGTVHGTLNNCASGSTPWGTYLSCEESTDNYLDPSQPEAGYGWVVEIDPQGKLAGLPVKRTALGRFSHENSSYRLGSDNRVAFYLGDDSTPGCIYKFVCADAYRPDDRAANADMLDKGTLHVARFAADGTGQWLALVQGRNGLVAGAVDPGDESQGPAADTVVDFLTQADVAIHTQAAARVAGATLMDRPESITVGPDGTVYCALTNNYERVVTDAANPRAHNRHGHIVRLVEAGAVPTASTFTWDIFLKAGDPSLATPAGNLVGDIVGDTFGSPDGLRVDPKGRMWIETDMSLPGDSGLTHADGSTLTNEEVFGNNGLYAVDPATRRSMRLLVGPQGCEITGIAYTPDLCNFFINIQHPEGSWPSAQQGNAWPSRSSTIVVRRSDGQPVGA